MTDFLHLPDLASRYLGGGVVHANDQWFAERENLVRTEAPVFHPHTFGNRGQVYDGWETRRRRESGHDEAIVRLGAAGIVRGVVVDTAFFTGNYPPEVSVEGCGMEGYPSPEEVAAAEWITLVPRSTVKGDFANAFPVDSERRFTHVRLRIYPDGGVARLRVHGEVVPDPRLLPAPFDLAALSNGGLVVSCSNMFYSSPNNLIMPGNAHVMGEGWETARRRDDGNDWVVVKLACQGVLRTAEIDTTHFTGNAPGWVQLSGLRAPAAGAVGPGDWIELLPRTRLQPDTLHRFLIASDEPVHQVRMDVFPDGGMARLRLIGAPSRADARGLTMQWFNALPHAQAEPLLMACCQSRGWASTLLHGRPYDDEHALVDAAVAGVRALSDAGLEAALSAHPRIGERPAGTGADAQWSSAEQAGVGAAPDTVRAELAEANLAYEARFGRVYLVCATGRSAEEMLDLCRQRLGNDPETEAHVVRQELAEITRLRLGKLLHPQWNV